MLPPPTMSFFARNKKKNEDIKAKKKWEIKSDSEDSEDAPTMECTVCQDSEPDLYCQTCKKYFCVRHFVAKHPVKDDTEALLSSENNPPSELSKHRCRLLIGVVEENLTGFDTGWLVNCDKTQMEKKQETEKQRKRKRHEDDQKERKREEDDKKRKMEEAREREEEEKNSKSVDVKVAFIPKTPEECARHIIVRNIPPEAGLADIRSFFRKAGRIIDILAPAPPAMSGNAGRKEHYGMVQIEFGDPKGAGWASAMDGRDLLGRRIQVMTVNQALDPTQESSARLAAFKVKMCAHYEKGRCFRGPACNFAHSPSELPGGSMQV